jgi:hypothetical protein
MVERETRIQTVCLLIISAVAIGAALFLLREVMIPFVLAIFSALALSPLMAFQRRYLRLPNPVAVLTTFLIGLVVLSLLGALIAVSLRQLVANADVYQQQINQLLDQVMTVAEGYGVETLTLFDTIAGLQLSSVSSMLATLTRGMFDLLSQGLLVLLFLFFLLLGDTQTTGPRRGVLGEIERRVRRYIVAKTVAAAVSGGVLGGNPGIFGCRSSVGVRLAGVFAQFHPQPRLAHRDRVAAPRDAGGPGAYPEHHRPGGWRAGPGRFFDRQPDRAQTRGRLVEPTPGYGVDQSHGLGHDVGHRRDVFSHSAHCRDADVLGAL